MSNSTAKKSKSVPASKRQRKLTSDLQVQVCQRLAAYERPTDVMGWLEAEHGIKLDLSTLLHYRDSDRWRPQFEAFRREYLADLESVPGHSLRWRLERLQRRIDKLEDEYRRTGRDVYGSAEGFGEVRTIIEDMRKECGDKLEIKADAKVQVGGELMMIPEPIWTALSGFTPDDPRWQRAKADMLAAWEEIEARYGLR